MKAGENLNQVKKQKAILILVNQRIERNSIIMNL